MDPHLKVLMVDASTSFYKVRRYNIGDYFGPVDLGYHLAAKYNSFNFGTGLLGGSIFPGSNRLIFTGFSPCWTGFYVSSMGGAGLVFENLGINMFSLVGKAGSPSVMYLNRTHGEEIEVEIVPVDVQKIWKEGRGGVYSMLDYMLRQYKGRYKNDPRVLATGPAALTTDLGAVCSVPVKNGENTLVDTWAGRGGFGSKMLQEHGIAAIIYGGTFIHDDFRDRKVADSWFENKFHKKMAAEDIEATTKYRYDPNFNTGGTLGVNYASLAGRIMFFNYRSIYMDETERLDVNEKFIKNHYLKQFNEETIAKKQQHNCGEPCAAVCKKMNGEYKKDYEPYQTMGPLTGIFDQRAAEKLNHHADMLGFDGISVGGVLAWLMDCLDQKLVAPSDLGVDTMPNFDHKQFNVETDSAHNADLGIALLNSIIEKKGLMNMQDGARAMAHQLSACTDRKIIDCFVYNSFARRGWMVPNQYWTAGALSPMAIMGKYYMHYANDFVPPKVLGHKNADRMRKELLIDNLGFCRFHRLWAEEMLPDIVESIYPGMKSRMLENINKIASRISNRNSSVYWESERNVDYVYTFLKRKQVVDKCNDPELAKWIDYFEKDKKAAALDYWYEIHKGAHEALKEF